MPDLVDQWLERARGGDREAFAALVRRFLPSVHEVVRLTSKGRGVPGDLVRETFHRAWGGLAGLAPRQDFGRWLGGIARYVCREAARRRAPFSVAVTRPTNEDATRDRTFAILGEMDATARDLLLLRHLDGLSREDAAARLGVSVEEFDRLAKCAREELRDALTAAGDGPP